MSVMVNTDICDHTSMDTQIHTHNLYLKTHLQEVQVPDQVWFPSR